jgi:hypothetical protein
MSQWKIAAELSRRDLMTYDGKPWRLQQVSGLLNSKANDDIAKPIPRATPSRRGGERVPAGYTLPIPHSQSLGSPVIRTDRAIRLAEHQFLAKARGDAGMRVCGRPWSREPR